MTRPSTTPRPRAAHLSAEALVRQTGLGFLRYAARKRFSMFLQADEDSGSRYALLRELDALIAQKRATVTPALRSRLERFFQYNLNLWRIGFTYVDEPERPKRARAPKPSPRR